MFESWFLALVYGEFYIDHEEAHRAISSIFNAIYGIKIQWNFWFEEDNMVGNCVGCLKIKLKKNPNWSM